MSATPERSLATAGDGTEVRGYDEGQGPVIVMIGPGLDDGRRTARLAACLTPRFRVIRLHRRQYRNDLKRTNPAPCTVTEEAGDVLAVVAAVGGPVVVYGHSSGAVVALEALVASPSSFTGAVAFEPPAVTATPLSGENGEILGRARAAVAAGRPGTAMALVFRHTVGLPSWQAWPAAALTAMMPRYRALISCQLDDLEAIDALGVRLDAYERIRVRTVLLGGDSSPSHLAERLDALARVIPESKRVIMRGHDHGADLKSPKTVARVIEHLAGEPSRGT
ncbi:alpha/beta hydrolase [Sphaerisporangium krabiense]|uniref:Pimeloyl-ACP methyl ester carboxylesterase n=1 Tax=Sphaerisporangium krabiense TaxID=763782 RepID=A0A7W8Z689_9ACTN|nr:alpha/beta hydrolase [Sphaerisporangium krabiense]MBB5628115.1 pimeloyl-ACP methyl ester carboxylesterase [Sphaerisporangium krabiense]GII62282.1 alpha/beta hydrolase [Sphaerisporangium krabiense]